jgi:hypothetical protein
MPIYLTKNHMHDALLVLQILKLKPLQGHLKVVFVGLLKGKSLEVIFKILNYIMVISEVQVVFFIIYSYNYIFI